MLKCQFCYEKYFGFFLSCYEKVGICSVLFTQGGWICLPVEKDLPVFPIVMGKDPESFVHYSLVLSYFLICFLPDQAQRCPTDALNVFSF